VPIYAAIGFAVPALVIWPLTAIWGDIPGPVEPFTIVGLRECGYENMTITNDTC